jgi:hypothetical protein
MRKFIGTVLSFLLVVAAGSVAPLASAQGAQVPKFLFASDYGQWQIPGASANTYQWSPGTICQVAPATSTNQFFAFATNAPILVADATNANSEILTPSVVSQTASFCSITITPLNSHYSFRVQSATGGLQEALNAVAAGTAYATQIYLDKYWYQAVGGLTSQFVTVTPTSVIAAAKGSSGLRLVDVTTSPFTYYAWNGTAYTLQGTATGGATKPTIAAGAAAGTSPTVANLTGGNGNAFEADVTTGTATTTGTLFTETWATSSAFGYLPTCTVTSTGTNVASGFTFAVTYPSSTHALLTVTGPTTPLTISTAYKFWVNCN